MTLTREEIQDKLRNLQDAIAEGILEVEAQGKRIKYRSLDDMRRIERSLMQELNQTNSFGFNRIVTVFEKY